SPFQKAPVQQPVVAPTVTNVNTVYLDRLATITHGIESLTLKDFTELPVVEPPTVDTTLPPTYFPEAIPEARQIASEDITKQPA
ncbi:hypothetical protein HDU99_007169, partial [Rhizoclosmatium hyalinum]